MKKVVILGRCGAGKSTAAIQLGKIAGLPVVELDKYFWKPGLKPTSKQEWVKVQQELASKKEWIMDGDLGKYDVLETRLKAADTVIILDFSLFLCISRALHRSMERADFWWWLITWRWLSRPKIIALIKTLDTQPDIKVFKNPRSLDKFILTLKNDNSSYSTVR